VPLDLCGNERCPLCYRTPIQSDDINHPSHYTQGNIEVIDFLESQPQLDFRAASAIKYLCRYKLKGAPLKDLKKARWYVERLIKEYENA